MSTDDEAPKKEFPFPMPEDLEDDGFDPFAGLNLPPPPITETTFPEEVPTSPELRIQIKKNTEMSKDVLSQASTIVEVLRRRSTHPPKG